MSKCSRDLKVKGHPWSTKIQLQTFYWILWCNFHTKFLGSHTNITWKGLKLKKDQSTNGALASKLKKQNKPSSNLLWKQNKAPAVHLTKQKNTPKLSNRLFLEMRYLWLLALVTINYSWFIYDSSYWRVLRSFEDQGREIRVFFFLSLLPAKWITSGQVIRVTLTSE